MPFRDAVLRGVRLAAILFAVILCAFTIYRMVRVTPADERKEPATPKASGRKPVIPSPDPGPQYPPPPPAPGSPARTHRTIDKRPPAGIVRPVEVAGDVAADSAPESKIEVLTSHDQTSTRVEDLDSAEVKNAVPDTAPDLTSAPDSPARPENRRRRWMKSMGRFLHIGARKDIAEQSVRQP